MKSLVKKKRVLVRLTNQEAADLERAARLESKRRGEIVGDSTLLRELGMVAVDHILALAEQHAAAEQARRDQLTLEASPAQ